MLVAFGVIIIMVQSAFLIYFVSNWDEVLFAKVSCNFGPSWSEVTAQLKEYVFDGYDVGAFHYLLKPVNEQKFKEVMERAVRQIQKKKKEEPLVIKVDGNYIKIPISNIIYAENEARKIVLHTKNMQESRYTFYEKMEVLESKLGDDFFCSHRGFLVNLAEVCKYDNANIILKNGEKAYLSKQKYNDFVTAYMNYLRKA